MVSDVREIVQDLLVSFEGGVLVASPDCALLEHGGRVVEL